MKAEVRVYCPSCKGGDNAIWEGSLIDWGLVLRDPATPKWFLYAINHERVHSHTVMVKYPKSGDVPLVGLVR